MPQPPIPSAALVLFGVSLKSLPAEDTVWKSEDRVKWLEAAAKCFDLMYGGSEGKISIHLTKDTG
jgi:hypothetical protein